MKSVKTLTPFRPLSLPYSDMSPQSTTYPIIHPTPSFDINPPCLGVTACPFPIPAGPAAEQFSTWPRLRPHPEHPTAPSFTSSPRRRAPATGTSFPPSKLVRSVRKPQSSRSHTTPARRARASGRGRPRPALLPGAGLAQLGAVPGATTPSLQAGVPYLVIPVSAVYWMLSAEHIFRNPSLFFVFPRPRIFGAIRGLLVG